MKKLKMTALISFAGVVLFTILSLRQYFAFHSEFNGKNVPVDAVIRGLDPVITFFVITTVLVFVLGCTLFVWLILFMKARWGKKSKQLPFA
ncbi:MAG TPA: hypothetical protein VGE29_01005 [Prosthecobacter sp.]